MSKISKQARADALAALREAIADVGRAADLRALEYLVRVADDLITDAWPELIDDEDMIELRADLVANRRGRLNQF
ncbi:hypothetical protein [Pseudomonas veronii]|uniref:hypothetical protein n=1 Tax=Pseudomonas veronii TaxID=76761 RepID=UPI0021C03E87|nr:hypothetical protein [Pseudomonas veronii]MCT9824844.1 hypothetical protein [Pseudomonas veronii]